MTNLEYQNFCLKKYKSFFNLLNQKSVEFFFENNKKIKIYINSHLYPNLTIDNIELPPNITFIQDIDLDLIITNYPKKRLPDNLTIEGKLIIKNSPNLHYFGKNTTIYNLKASYSHLKNINNVKVDGDLDLSHSFSIIKLPDNLKLYDLNLTGSSVKKLGKNTIINGSLLIEHSSLEELPDGLYVCDGVYANYSSLKKIGKNIHIDWVLDLSNTCVKKLGKNLRVKDSLIIDHNKFIKKINKDVFVGNMISFNESELEEFGDGFVFNKDLNLSLASKTKLKKLGKNTIIKGRLIIDNQGNKINFQLKELPNGLIVETGLDIIGDTILKLGKKTVVKGWFHLKDSVIKELPNDIIIKNNKNYISIKGNSKLNKLPLSLLNSQNSIKIEVDEKEMPFFENIDLFYSQFIYYDKPVNITKIFSSYSKEIDFKSWLINVFSKISENNKKNTLLYNINIPLQKKLLLGQFDKITDKEIKHYISDKSSITNDNDLNNISSKIEENNISNTNLNIFTSKTLESKCFSILKGKFPLILYCREKSCFEFLYKNGYSFTKEEYKEISFDDDIKNIYEMYLLKYNLNNN